MQERTASIGPDGRAALKWLAVDGAMEGPTTVTCAGLADRLDASSQTASRRLRRLEDAGLVAREVVGDGQRVRVTDDGERVLRREYEQYRRLFDGDAGVALRGRITGGMGEGRHYISLPGYMEQFRERLGYEPFAGTLNVELDEESVRRRARMNALDPVRIDGWEDEDRTYGPAFCWPTTVATPGDADRFEPAHVIAPERTHHGADQLEVIAPAKLRAELGLEDDDPITVHVETE